MIRAIGFDLDDTLWAVKPVIIAAEKKLSQHLREVAPTLSMDVEGMRHLREQVMKRDPTLRHRLTEMRRRVIEAALLQSDIPPAEADALSNGAMDVFLAARNSVTFFDGVEEGLQQLTGSFTMGALSNGNADIHRAGLGEYFTFAFSAEQVGAPKPNPDLFHAALEHLAINPSEMVYVGDDPVLDVDAANRVGLRTVWMKNPARENTGTTSPDAVITNLRQLPDVLDRFS